MTLVIAVTIFALLQLADFYSTLVALAHGARELNPFLRTADGGLRKGRAITVKAVAAGMVAALAFTIGGRILPFVLVLDGIFTAVVLWNLRMIWEKYI